MEREVEALQARGREDLLRVVVPPVRVRLLGMFHPLHRGTWARVVLRGRVELRVRGEAQELEVVLRRSKKLVQLVPRDSGEVVVTRLECQAFLAVDPPFPLSLASLLVESHRSGSSHHSSSSKSKSDKLSSSTGKGSSSSNAGGSTKTGSGVTPNYGGGRYYGGGATTPYKAGARSPLGILAVPLTFSALAFYPGIWLYGAYAYPYSHPYTFHNRTATNHTNTTTTRDLHFDIEIRQDTGVTETKNVTCLCAMYAECGCDDNGNTTFLDSLIGDGTYANLNLSLVNVADINGTSTIVLNGTLPNGTTAAGGTENASGAVRTVIEMSGYWVMIALVGATVYLV